MRIGVPRERKPLEGRVALVPEACAHLVALGHEVWVERGAGRASGYPDDAYAAAGARFADDPAGLYEAARLVVKVKEPVGRELELLRPDHLLFCFLHLAALPELKDALCRIGLTAVAFETVEKNGGLPLLAPMSEIAGRLSVQIGAHLLHRPQGGRGLLLGGITGAPRGRVVVLGCGSAGMAAAQLAVDTGSEVIAFDLDRERLASVHPLGTGVTALFPYADAVREAVAGADIVIGAVLVPGARAPRVVDAAMVRSMPSGSVIVDVSVDQGGCVETTRPTTYDEPTYVVDDVIHFTVTNMPGAVPRTASQALSAVLTPYVERLAAGDWESDPALAGAVNVRDGRAVLETLRG
ncbi:MAG TPA: alanine dehydrogenase [Gammaproteobacteria bacterium]|nr:alanine dehydrogenase [Gammaproteobacteria bacterium]